MTDDDNFLNSVKQLRVQIKEIVKKDKLMAHIVKRSLDPILQTIEQIHHVILADVGKMVVEVIKEKISETESSGRTYIIVQFNPDIAPYEGGRYENIDTYDASAPLSSPASYTGALMDSIGFEVTKAGVLKIGQVNITTGGWSEGKLELLRKSVFFRGNKIFVNDEIGKAKSVGVYSQYLEEGTDRMAARPWISETLKEMHEAIKDYIKERMHQAIKRRTRSEGVQKAFTFNVFIARR
jgi:hypothetical protein